MNRKTHFKHKKAGFTLIEIMLVIGLIALLAGVSIIAVDGMLGGNEIKLTRLKVKESFATPLTKYRLDTGSYPTTEQGLSALLTKPSNVRGQWMGPYLKSKDDLLDAWKNPLKYRYPGTKNPGSYDLYSLGPDGMESDDDIGNWD